MNDMPEQPEPIQVDTTKEEKGQVKFFTKGAFKGDTPTILARVTEGIRYFATALIATVGATDLFTGRQPKIICFILAVVILLCGTIDKAVGVVPKENGNS